jgi:hypothetical protein
MNKFVLLPKLSVMGLKKTAQLIFVYSGRYFLGFYLLCIFLYLKNDIVKTLPHSAMHGHHAGWPGDAGPDPAALSHLHNAF